MKPRDSLKNDTLLLVHLFPVGQSMARGLCLGVLQGPGEAGPVG